MLSDYPFHFLGRTITITGREQFLAFVFLFVAAVTWGVLQVRRRRAVVLQRSAVSDQIVYELSRIADALDRLAGRSLDQKIHRAPLDAFFHVWQGTLAEVHHAIR
ncbi:MAG: hypothetical protein DMG39_00145 [Acidobacteria bacterium]|nr:MAG: hypothetical protein DMG39_00145 [Acidobacteriota bacterium]